MYLGWFDDSPKRPIPDRIAAGVAAFRDRFGYAPAFVLVNEFEAEGLTIETPRVIPKSWIRRGNYWLGMSDC